MPSVAITIPTLAGGDTLEACLRALNRQTYRDFEVIIVDNGQRRDTGCAGPSGTPYRFPVLVVTPGANLGFGAAINLGARATDARFIATLNDDTEPDPEWLEALVRELESHPRIGMCASNIRLFASGCLDSAGMLICLDGSSKQRGGSMPPACFPNSEDVLLPSACAALYRREMLDEIGLFDEDFFLYCEDTDLGLRARWAGWRCRYAAGATIRHHYSRTAEAFSPLKARFVERNRIWVAVKNFPVALLVAVPCVAVARYLWQLGSVAGGRGAAAGFIRSGQSLQGAFGILARAHWETLLHLPALVRKRASARGSRRIGSLEFIRLLYRHRITARELARA
jgi:GT2 family glycosyltransferase